MRTIHGMEASPGSSLIISASSAAGFLQAALGAVVTVGGGRGFIVEAGCKRYVITAAHCLPHFPPCRASYLEERTYKDLLAPLGEQPSIWCECLFADPIADIALLGSPDNQDLSDKAEAYEAFAEAVTPLSIAEPPSLEPVTKARHRCSALLLSLKNQWFSCTVEHAPGGMLDIRDAGLGIAPGMSGSPIIAEDGTAIGIVCLASGKPGDNAPKSGGPNPRLMGNLPGWFLRLQSSGTRAMKTKTCPDCNGDGVVDKDTDDERQCPMCGGSGFVPDDDDDEELIRTTRA